MRLPLPRASSDSSVTGKASRRPSLLTAAMSAGEWGRGNGGEWGQFSWGEWGQFSCTTTRYEYDASNLGQTGQVVRRALPSATNQPWTVDWTYGDNLADRRLEAIDHSPRPNNGARNHAYTTSPEHRILGLTESTAAGATATWSYGYDLADRLTDALVTPGGAYAYDLDDGDNLLSIQTPPGIATSTYNSLNQIDLRNGQPFTYDAAGNLLDDGQRSYEWDAAQRLVRIRYPGSTRFTEFRYDGLGRRSAILEWHNNNYTETPYLWCGERICQARNGNDAVIRRYYDEGEQAVNLTGPTTPYYYAQDHLGSVRDLVNASGQVLASYDYDPYGNPTRTEEGSSARADYRYAGLLLNPTVA